MRIGIVGAGAVGGYLAARLAHAGHRVALVARGAHLDAIREGVLTLETPDGRLTVAVEASERPGDLGAQDLVITSAKTPALPDLVAGIGPMLGPETPVVTAMNGVFWWYAHGFAPEGRTPPTGRLDPDGRLARAIPAERALGMIVYSSNEVIAPGTVRNVSTGNRYLVGAADPAGLEQAEAVARALDGSGFTIEATAEIRRAMWTKLVRNLSSAPISVLTGATVREIMDDSPVRRVSRALFEEGAAVAAAHGFEGLAGDADPVFAPGTGPTQKPSMRQDLERGRPMEIDSMLRIVQDFARDSGVATPRLDTVVALVVLRARMAGLYTGW